MICDLVNVGVGIYTGVMHGLGHNINPRNASLTLGGLAVVTGLIGAIEDKNVETFPEHLYATSIYSFEGAVEIGLGYGLGRGLVAMFN